MKKLLCKIFKHNWISYSCMNGGEFTQLVQGCPKCKSTRVKTLDSKYESAQIVHIIFGLDEGRIYLMNSN